MEAALWPYGKCKKCANKNYCAWSQNEILDCMNNGYQNFSAMRNADRIRAMTDEELAHLLHSAEEHLFTGNLWNYEKWMEWLKQEEVCEEQR